MSHSPLYDLIGGAMLVGIGIVCAVGPARSEAVTLQALAEWSPPHPTDVSCEWGKPMNGQRQMFCRQIYSDGSSDTYWQKVTIEDGVVAVLEEE